METAPKPRLTDSSYRENYLNDEISLDERLDMVAKREFITTEKEILGVLIMVFGQTMAIRVADMLNCASPPVLTGRF